MPYCEACGKAFPFKRDGDGRAQRYCRRACYFTKPRSEAQLEALRVQREANRQRATHKKEAAQQNRRVCSCGVPISRGHYCRSCRAQQKEAAKSNRLIARLISCMLCDRTFTARRSPKFCHSCIKTMSKGRYAFLKGLPPRELMTAADLELLATAKELRRLRILSDGTVKGDN